MLSAYIIAIAVISLSTVSCEQEANASSESTEEQILYSSNLTGNETTLRGHAESVTLGLSHGNGTSTTASNEEHSVQSSNSTENATVPTEPTSGFSHGNATNTTASTASQDVQSSNSTENPTVPIEPTSGLSHGNGTNTSASTGEHSVHSGNSTDNKTRDHAHSVTPSLSLDGETSTTASTEEHSVQSGNSTDNKTRDHGHSVTPSYSSGNETNTTASTEEYSVQSGNSTDKKTTPIYHEDTVATGLSLGGETNATAFTEEHSVQPGNSTGNETTPRDHADTTTTGPFPGEETITSASTEDHSVHFGNSTDYENATFPPDFDDDPPTPEKYNHEGICNHSDGTPQVARNGILKLLNDFRVKVVRGEQRNGEGFSNPDNSTLPRGMFMRELGWSCDLERAAIDALNKTCTAIPVAPNGTTPFFDSMEVLEWQQIAEKKRPWRPFGPGTWFYHVETYGLILDGHTGSTPIYFLGGGADSANLLRYNISRVGCALKLCEGNKTFSIFRLTNKPPLRQDAIIYYGGNGSCPKGRCEPGLTCHNETGLCVEQHWISTTTTPVPTTTECFNGGSFWLAGFFYNWFGKDPCWARWYPTSTSSY
ncbi:hypothetical protein Y032_0119g842 [Ancylostoma ceylanicum]|uniref:SCP domain-containing protein n=1 Tax=Ancylostoma ceylanicum TaxID=53326 RepID=A0A016TB86_9BILA|nr:hypothetical protein Y032_0119g842 [Ancylostoma ceylanicum]